MYSSNNNNQLSGQDVYKLSKFFSHRLRPFSAPLFLQLDELLDKPL